MERVIDLISQRDHPQRRALTEEMHLRHLPRFAAPTRLMQLVVYTPGTPTESGWRHAGALLDHSGLPAPLPGKYFRVQLGELAFAWEQHSEVATYTFVLPGSFDDPFAEPLLQRLPADWVAALPGQVLRATQVALLPRAQPEPDDAQLARWFSPDELVCCDVQGGEARLWSNFRVHEDGFGRLLLQDRGLVGDGDPSRLVQRLQELGNYRNLALLGLPVAQQLTPQLAGLEHRLAQISRSIAAGSASDESLMGQVSQLAAELTELTTAAGFRMSATRAYAQIVADRLATLGLVRVAGHKSLSDFTERRLTPAMRTCDSVWKRAGQLAEHTTWAGSLLRMRVETALERQNAALLASMDQRARLQLRLQQAVEGLSVIAISYYAVGILGYCFKALNHVWPGLDSGLASGIAAPLVVLVTWLLMRRLHKRIEAP
ncbi:MAG: hypothetical protein RL684_1555 [Pseudomonadota bacterium]|jgi:uncharacterized membrane-anchored protein